MPNKLQLTFEIKDNTENNKNSLSVQFQLHKLFQITKNNSGGSEVNSEIKKKLTDKLYLKLIEISEFRLVNILFLFPCNFNELMSQGVFKNKEKFTFNINI